MSTGRPRALLTTVDLPPSRGGIQTMVREICSRSSCVAAVVAPGPPVEHGLAVDVRFARGPGRRARILSLALAARAASRRLRPDVLLAMHPLAALGAIPGSLPTVVFVHGGELRSPRIRRVAYRVLPRAAAVLANSHHTERAAIVAGADPARTSVLHVGAPEPVTIPPEDAERRRAALGGGRIVLCVGRLTPHKGHEVLVDSVPHLPQDARVVVVGRGQAREALEARVAAGGLADRVVFTGALDDADLARTYAAADAFVLPSLDDARGVEGGGIVLLEAAAYGLPIVATATGGVPETIADGETGLLVPVGDALATARALTRVLVDGALARRLGERAHAMATTERTWEAFVAELDSILIRTVERAREGDR